MLLLNDNSCDTTSPFYPMDAMDHDNNNTDRGKSGLASISQAPMFTVDQLQAMHQQSQQRTNTYNQNQQSTKLQFQQESMQQQYASNTANQNWMQLLQPTPLGNTVQNQPNANHSQSSGREMQLMLQQLFQDQRNQEGTTNNQTQTTSLFTLGSTVEPINNRNGSDSDQEQNDFFKGMWDVEEIALPGMGKPSQPSKAATKRKWTKNGGAPSYAQVVVSQNKQQNQYAQFQNQVASQQYGNSFSQPEPAFSFENDAMDDSDDFLQYSNRIVKEESPMSTSSGLGVPPKQLTLPASVVSSARGSSGVVQQQHAPQIDDSNTVSISEEDYAFLLPSTLLPPSVMASMLHPGLQTGPNTAQKGATTGSGGGRYKKKKGTKSTRIESPLDALQRILSLQGYGPIRRIPAEDAQYETVPSALQLASFGTELVKAIHASDTQRLSTLLETGLSPNPCNKFRDSMVDLVCKRANGDIFKCLVNHGCDLRVCDGFGRTPLHHCCWAHEFSAEIAETILEIDWLQLFIEDKRGQIPVEYIRPDQAAEWIEFLEDNRQRFFPIGGNGSTLHAVRHYRPDNVLPDPPNALPIELASAVSSGRLTPEELATMDPAMMAKFR